ncbi:MAG: SprT-like domain-containing protein [Fimbriimonadales bacterium]
MNLLDYIEYVKASESGGLEAVAACALEEATRLLPMQGSPKIVWKNYRSTAGRAYLYENTICLSKRILTDETRVRETVLHEYAHLFVFERYGHRAKPHGREWKLAMRKLGVKADVTHDYEYQRNSVTPKHAYPCEKCGELIHRVRPLRWGQMYLHVGCGGRIRHVDHRDASRLQL